MVSKKKLQQQIDALMTLLAATQDRVEQLEWQIQHSATGHEFKLKDTYCELRSPGKIKAVWGKFVCRKCDLQIARKLTKQEIAAVKKLGMINKCLHVNI